MFSVGDVVENRVGRHGIDAEHHCVPTFGNAGQSIGQVRFLVSQQVVLAIESANKDKQTRSFIPFILNTPLNINDTRWLRYCSVQLN